LASALLVVGVVFAQGPAHQSLESSAVASEGAHSVRPRPARVDALEQRVQLLTHELDLNSGQQEAVRQILRGQRDAVRSIWQDAAISPAERAPAVRLVGERTADRIRGVLNEEQKKKYNRPTPDGALSTQANADVEGWLRTVLGETRENPLGVTLPSSRPLLSEAP
jgi:hypothetical protein